MQKIRLQTLEASSDTSGMSQGYETESNMFLPSGNHNVLFPGNLQESKNDFQSIIDDQQNRDLGKVQISKVSQEYNFELESTESYNFSQTNPRIETETDDQLIINSNLLTETEESMNPIDMKFNYEINNKNLHKYTQELKQSEILEVENSELESKSILNKSGTPNYNNSLANSPLKIKGQYNKLYDSVVSKQKPPNKNQQFTQESIPSRGLQEGIDLENQYSDLLFTSKTKDTDRKTKIIENDDDISITEFGQKSTSKQNFNERTSKIFSEDSQIDRDSITKSEARNFNQALDNSGAKIVYNEIKIENVREIAVDSYETKEVHVDKIYLKKVPKYRNRFIEVENIVKHYVEIPKTIEKKVFVEKEIIQIKYVDEIIEKPVEVIKLVEVPEFRERIVEKPIEIVIEKIVPIIEFVEIIKEVPRQVIKVVDVEKNKEVIKYVDVYEEQIEEILVKKPWPKPPTDSNESQTFLDSQNMKDSFSESPYLYEELPESTVENIDSVFTEQYNTDKSQLYKWFLYQKEKMDLGNKNFKRAKPRKKKIVRDTSTKNIEIPVMRKQT